MEEKNIDELNFEDEQTDNTEPESKDKDEEGSSNKNEVTKKQTSKENREWKNKRILHEAYVRGKMDAIKVNPFTKKEIKSERDLELYEEMLNASKNGDENAAIIGGYESYINRQNAKEEEEAKSKEIKTRQLKELKEAIPDSALREKILKDSDFSDLYGSMITSGGDLGKAAKTFVRLKGWDKTDKSYEEGRKMSGSAPTPSGDYPEKKPDYSNLNDKEVHDLFGKTKFGGR